MNKKDDVLVFSNEKYEKVTRAQYEASLADILVERSKGWREECEGLTPEEMAARYYPVSDAWLVKKNEQ